MMIMERKRKRNESVKVGLRQFQVDIDERLTPGSRGGAAQGLCFGTWWKISWQTAA